jgi:hypothetical protein
MDTLLSVSQQLVDLLERDFGKGVAEAAKGWWLNPIIVGWIACLSFMNVGVRLHLLTWEVTSIL